eukprot:987607-Prorocentrum_minimum.AAC.1
MVRSQEPCSLRRSEGILQLLRQASKSSDIPQEMRTQASSLLTSDESIPWVVLRNVCSALRAASGESNVGPWLHQVAAGGGLDLKPPPTRTKGPELEARLKKLRVLEEERKYAELTSDVRVKERLANDTEHFSTFKEHIGFGTHVIVVMFTLFLLGHHAAKHVSESPIIQISGGLFGAIIGMMVETLLFIIRASRDPVKN